MSEPLPRRVAIVGGLRTPFCRAGTQYADASNKDMLGFVLQTVVERYGLKGERLGDVSAGATFKHPRDWNLAREATLDSGLSRETPAYDLQRACGTSLSACAQIANKIALGQIEAGIGAGVDSISDLPLEFTDRFRHAVLEAGRAKTLSQRLKSLSRIRPSDFKPQVPGVVEPHTHLSMGQSCENMARDWHVSRESQDKLALASHRNATSAWKTGFYDDLVAPFAGAERDNNVREDTSLEKLAKLPTAFARDSQATLTAGNSSPLTDGAAAVLLASEGWAAAHGLPVLAYLTDVEVYGLNISSLGYAGLFGDNELDLGVLYRNGPAGVWTNVHGAVCHKATSLSPRTSGRSLAMRSAMASKSRCCCVAASPSKGSGHQTRALRWGATRRSSPPRRSQWARRTDTGACSTRASTSRGSTFRNKARRMFSFSFVSRLSVTS